MSWFVNDILFIWILKIILPTMRHRDKVLDLNPLDCTIWGSFEELVYLSGYVITDVKSLKVVIKAAWSKLSQRQINKTKDQ